MLREFTFIGCGLSDEGDRFGGCLTKSEQIERRTSTVRTRRERRARCVRIAKRINVETGEEIRRYREGYAILPDFTTDGRYAFVGYNDGPVELWRIDATLDDLLEWVKANRFIPDISCEQRALYRVEPLCKPAE